jgi:hypothetical protein
MDKLGYAQKMNYMFSQFMAVKHNLEDEVPNGRYNLSVSWTRTKP